MAFTAITAVLAGTASTAVVIAAIGEVGLAMTVVGAATGSKKLMKVGAVMGLASGIGSIANSAFGAATATAEETAANLALGGTDGMGSVAADAGLSASENAALGGSDGMGGIINDAMGSNIPSVVTPPVTETSLDVTGGGDFQPKIDTTASLNGSGDVAQPAPQMTANAPAPDAPIDAAANNLQPEAAQTSPASSSSAVDTTQPIQSTTDSANVSGNPSSSANSPSDADLAAGLNPSIDPTAPSKIVNGSSYFDKLGNYLKSDRGLNTTLQLGAGALSGVSKAVADNRTYELNKQAADMKKQQQANANDQVRVAGIINKARAA